MVTNSDRYNRLVIEIEKLDKKIDHKVYKLYDLVEEEVKVVERKET